ncbi:GNAT family N-acetyltransferase [Candidatus Phycosocius spiralis]|nr:GNAT family N-acetyltransferase [Candidatus Phycosocius spiralis]
MIDDGTSPFGSFELKFSSMDKLADIARADWDRLANPPERAFDPFVSWDFVQALEECGCATTSTGWSGRHLVCLDSNDQILGLMPLWLKSHSQGEYIFDHNFAEAWHRAGGYWYPKLISAVPFTPVAGRRFLIAPNETQAQVRGAMIRALEEIGQQSGLATIQINFPKDEDLIALETAGWLLREDRQFHFFNRNYSSFDDFLAELSSDKRKNLRKERAKAQEGLTIVRLTGDQIQEEHLDHFFACYQDTGERKWGNPYLNRRFFSLLAERMADKMVLIMAQDGDRWIASALNFLGSEAIYGRWWGRLEDRPFLHFELCYYQAIDEAIARGLTRVEAGAQGGHKLARGYVPVSTWQASWISDPLLRAAVSDYLTRERAAIADDSQWLAERMPFRHNVHQMDMI